MKTSYFLSVFLTTLILFSCADTQKKDEYKNSRNYSFSSSDLEISREFEDFGKAYAVYMVLGNGNPDFSIEIICSELNSDSMNRPETYFILQKFINTDEFKDSRRTYIFTEIYRNYSKNWAVTKHSVIHSENSFFTQKLTSGIYKITFTCFSEKNFTAEFITKTNGQIFLFDSLEKARVKTDRPLKTE